MIYHSKKAWLAIPAGITLAIVMLVVRVAPTWLVAAHRFAEVSIGIAVGLAVTAVWPERD